MKSVTRRLFPAATAALFGAGKALADSVPVLRVVAYNVYKCTGWPSDRPDAVEFRADLDRVAKAYADELSPLKADIICFSESPKEPLVKAIADHLKMEHRYFPSGGNWPGSILTPHKILEAEDMPLVSENRPKDLFTRHWARALIQLPTGMKLPFHSAHLMPADNQKIRIREISGMIKRIDLDAEKYGSVVIAGDLNHEPDTLESQLWIDAGVADTFLKKGEGDGFTIKADTPDRRIDYVMAAGPIAKKCQKSQPLFEGRFRLDTQNTEAFALSDHLPQLAVFEMPDS
ncbi:endonuclease/exonuclease/phosphatase family protein [Verrucomicrobiales bacterium]|nr:endonuclease/exonuclease/phosphatase family protein [Verrucomicrobiales bacterium]